MTTGRPTRESLAGRTYLDLRRAARTARRTTDEYLRLYVLESFLARLAASPHADRLIVKGGVLLAAYAVRRPTADIDVAARDLPGQTDQLRELVRDIARLPAEDGVDFDTIDITADQIREEDQYSGVRVTLTARLATAAIRFHVDINIGDPTCRGPRFRRPATGVRCDWCDMGCR